MFLCVSGSVESQTKYSLYPLYPNKPPIPRKTVRIEIQTMKPENWFVLFLISYQTLILLARNLIKTIQTNDKIQAPKIHAFENIKDNKVANLSVQYQSSNMSLSDH